jgi:hypothetical protein
VASNDPTYPDNADSQLEAMYTVELSYPSGTVELVPVSDVIRVETFGAGCAPADQDISFLVAAKVKGVGVLIKQTGLISGTSKTFAAVPKDGMFEVTATIGEPTDFAAFADVNECAMPPTGCSKFASCVDTVGSYMCQCLPGYKGDGRECVEETYECPEMTVKVTNADMLTFGWRVREMRLYRSETCDPASEVGLTVAGTAREYKAKATFTGTPIDSYSHPREIVRALQCFTKCSTGEYKGARKLSKARRMQVVGSDWANCAGVSGDNAAVMTPTSTADSVLCASQPTCEDVCNQLPECTGFFMPSSANGNIDKCLLFKAGDAAPAEVTGVSGSFYEKAFKVHLTASPSEPSHPKELVYDGYGMSHALDGVAADSLNTEYWTECFDCDPHSTFVQVTLSLTVGPGEPCQIHGLQFWQDPEYMSALNVYVGTDGGLPKHVGSRGAAAVEQSLLLAPFYFAHRFEGAAAMSCMSLTCGQKEVLYTGKVLPDGAIDHVDSPCLCKQMCLENVHNGCEIWGLYHEMDDHGADDEIHPHMVCYLMGGDWDTAAPSDMWVSDKLETVLTGASLADGFVTVTGVHMPKSSSARIKIVDSDCEAPPAAAVSGIGCSDASICSPGPVHIAGDMAMWTGISIMATDETVKYTVCYCPGPCHEGFQYIPAPGAIVVEGSGFMWEASIADLDRSTGTFDLHVSRPPLHISSTYSSNEDWALKVVPASGDCTATPMNVLTNSSTLPGGTFPDNFNDKTFTFEIEDVFLSAAKYLVCFDDGEGTFIPISSKGSMFLSIGVTDEDLALPPGCT